MDTRHIDPHLSFIFLVVSNPEEAVEYRTLSQKFNVVPAGDHNRSESGFAEYTFAALSMGKEVMKNQQESPCDERETNNKAYHKYDPFCFKTQCALSMTATFPAVFPNLLSKRGKVANCLKLMEMKAHVTHMPSGRHGKTFSGHSKWDQ